MSTVETKNSSQNPENEVENSKSSNVTRIIQAVIALAGLYVILQRDLETGSITEIVIKLCALLFIVLMVGFVEAFFSNRNIKYLMVAANSIVFSVLAFVLLILASFGIQDLCYFHNNVTLKIFSTDPVPCKSHIYEYRITTVTGNDEHNESKDNVEIKLIGNGVSTSWHHLNTRNLKDDKFDLGKLDEFVIPSLLKIDQLEKIQIKISRSTENTIGHIDDLKLDEIKIEELTTRKSAAIEQDDLLFGDGVKGPNSKNEVTETLPMQWESSN